MDTKFIYQDLRGIADKDTFDAVFGQVPAGPLDLLKREKISVEKMAKVESLSFESKKKPIRDLEFLRYFPSLRSLHIKGQPLLELEPLKHVPRLEYLSVSQTPVQAVGPIAVCSNLRHFTMHGVKVGQNDFYALGQLGKVTNLELIDCGIADISWVTAMKSLVVAGFDGNQITSVPSFRELSDLQMVSIDNNLYTPPFV